MITIIKAPIFCARQFLVLLAMNASHVAEPWRGAAFERRRTGRRIAGKIVTQPKTSFSRRLPRTSPRVNYGWCWIVRTTHDTRSVLVRSEPFRGSRLPDTRSVWRTQCVEGRLSDFGQAKAAPLQASGRDRAPLTTLSDLRLQIRTNV
jgi:hypothetical protein